MRTLYLQNYILDNYILIAIVVGTFMVIFMESAVEVSTKKKMAVNMTLLLFISIIQAYVNYLQEQSIKGMPMLIAGVLYGSLRPVIVAIMINIIRPRTKFIWIPAVANCLVYLTTFFNVKVFYWDAAGEFHLGILGYSFFVTDWIYWIMMFLILNVVFYTYNKINKLAIFFCLSWIFIANVLDIMNVKPGILINTYAVVFLFYYLVVLVFITRRVTEEKEITLREQRVALMLSQIQPHFLYNTLNTITALCRANPKLAEETTVKFSLYLRENMYDMSERDLQPFSKELEHTNIYLDIEKLRFGDRVKTEYDIKVDDFMMPTLTLQPIVENAVKHGICQKMSGGTIKISTEKKGRDYVITVEDDGLGFVPGEIYNDGKEHIGIVNVKERLRSISRASIEIDSFVGIGTKVTITIPGERKPIRHEEGERREILSIGR